MSNTQTTGSTYKYLVILLQYVQDPPLLVRSNLGDDLRLLVVPYRYFLGQVFGDVFGMAYTEAPAGPPTFLLPVDNFVEMPIHSAHENPAVS